MSTQNIQLRTVEEFMADYTPIYNPIYPLFLGAKAQQWSQDVGQLNFHRLQAAGDIRTKRITPKDTEIKQVAIVEGKKTYKKYFNANQFRISDFQNRQGVEEVVTQILDEHHLHADEMLLFGEGTSGSDVMNNGLFYSGDPNYDLEDSVAVASTSRLYDLLAKVVTTATLADQVAGRKVIFFYGTDILPLFDSVFDTAVKAFKVALGEVLGSNYSFVKIPPAATPAGESGWIIANMDQVKLHYTTLPTLLAQGINSENMYLWFNFLMGSMMMEVLAKYAVIRQPATLAV